MNKAEFIEALAAHFDGNKAEAGRALNAITETITYQTAGGERVTITGFGVFEKVARPARMVRNPRTGERKRAKATAVPRFRAGTELKAYVSGAKKVPKATKKAAAKTAAPGRDGSQQVSCDQGGHTFTASVKPTSNTAPATKTTAANKATPAKSQSRQDGSRHQDSCNEGSSDPAGDGDDCQEGHTSKGDGQEGHTSKGDGQEGHTSKGDGKKAAATKSATAKTAPAAAKRTPARSTATATTKAPAKNSRTTKAVASR